MTLTIDAPVLIDGMPEAEYHAHPALSASGAKRILPPSCPSVFKWERDNGRPEKRAFDFGHAAHGLVLGVGEPLVVVDAENWMTKAAKEQRDAAYAVGHVPILKREHVTVQAMADAILAHPVASVLFRAGNGAAERSFFWHDARHGVDRRARLDWLTTLASGRACAVDYKTTTSANSTSVAKSAFDFRYFMQDAWYRDALIAASVDDDPAFLFVFQSKEPPYLVTVAELDADAVRLGREWNDRALSLFAECTANDYWPGYSDDIELISLPAWATKEYL